MNSKVKCKNCDEEILQSTFDKNDGLCMVCLKQNNFIKANPDWERKNLKLKENLKNYEIDNFKVHLSVIIHPPHPYVACIEEFPALVSLGKTIDKAVKNLKKAYFKRVKDLLKTGEKIPMPGSGKAKIKFWPNDKISTLRPFVDEFWEKVMGQNYISTFISDESIFLDFEDEKFITKEKILERTLNLYDVDISHIYDSPIYNILFHILNKKNQNYN